ncbi:radical SAM family heme chaperone HemW [Paludibacteraceae bacterium OttesenSCG-928-F17]|nr:radical SAM family heme chaperone HemW [Paludibacteraceae bacterium OttesenSCG-928-F17]
MAGIYIHIPFCEKRCSYCDFYSTTSHGQKSRFIDALSKEIELRKDYLKGEKIETVYFGGGTPSLLDKDDFTWIFEKLDENFIIDENAEITLEANPDDLTVYYLEELRQLPFNRLSIGIQSFSDTDLVNINRRHTSNQAVEAVKNAQKFGFNNISIDLIYGLPAQSLEDWEKQIDTALSLGIQHISAYGLTYEEGTVLWKQRENGKINTVDDDTMIEMYRLLNKKTEERRFERYEISNFSLPDFHSKHNSSYWHQKPYLGLGPSAHSYDGDSRLWNISSLEKFIDSLSQNELLFEKEILSLNEKYNDFILVSLRTSKGLNVNKLEKEFGEELRNYCLENIKTFIETQKVDYSGGYLRLTLDGILISDHIFTQLIKV